VICQNSDEDVPDMRQSDELFVIEEALRDTTKEEYDRVYRCISNANIDLGLSVPVYEVAWKHMINYRRGRLQEMILLYKRLEETIERITPGKLVCTDGVEPAYRSAVVDVGAEYNVPVTSELRSPKRIRLQRFLVSSVLIIPFFLDQILGLVLKRLTGGPETVSTAFVPALGRLDSMTPVLREMNGRFDVVITAMTSSWLWKLRDRELDAFDPTPVSRFSTLGCLKAQVMMHFRLSRRVFFSDMLKGQLEHCLAEQLDVQLDRALVYSLQQGFRTRMFGSLNLYYLFGNLIDERQCDKLVIGGLSPAGKAIIARGIDDGIEVCHIPHGINAAANSPNPPPELNQFVSGELEKRHYEASAQVEDPWNCIPTGRPYLTTLYDEYGGESDNSGKTDVTHIVLATQPVGPREEFVVTAIEAIQNSSFDATVTIKIHPSESTDWYSRFSRYDGVEVVDGNLHDLLYAADLTVTVNSNVGVESVVVGTPCVSLNWWSPIIPIPMYAQYERIPVVTEKKTVVDFFQKLENDRLAEMATTQIEVIHDYYELDVDAGKRIATRLDSPPLGDG
jgi:hypothetical protein